jgi:hypothetical protein
VLCETEKFQSTQKHQATISPRTNTFFRFFPCSKWAEHGRQNARMCLVSNMYGNREWSVSISSCSGKEGKIIGISIQSRENIVASKITRPVLGPTILYKVAQYGAWSSPLASALPHHHFVDSCPKSKGTSLPFLHRLKETSTFSYIAHCDNPRWCAVLLRVVKPYISKLNVISEDKDRD